MSSNDKKNLLLFFDRPTEPCFMVKGEDNVAFQLPEHYYPEKYQSASQVLGNRFGNEAGRTIDVENIALPDIKEFMALPYNEQFSLFVPQHRQLAGGLIDIFMGMRNVADLQSICAYCQMRINPYMFNYCLSVAILHRDDTKGLDIPTFVETFPDKFVDPKAIRRAREVTINSEAGNRMPIVIPQNYTASDREPEQRVAYFREDIGINLHHWHWHLVYPFEMQDITIVNKDRRGELFYYMHQQIVARYNVERLCNNLRRVTRFSNFREPIAEAYFPKLDSTVASRTWPPRFENSVISDLNRPVNLINADVSLLESWRDRFRQAVAEMAIRLPNSNRKLPLDEATGIDVLGNIMESSMLSRNRDYYGDLHNMGHVFISYCHDPDHSNLELFGVMGDSGTAMRDPVFYRWHAYVDDLFQEYKDKLPAYTNDKLDFAGVRVSSISVSSPRGANRLGTQWEQSSVELARGLDFMPRGSVLGRFTHLQHDEFLYNIEVNNTSGRGLMGTVRIFIAPVLDEEGRKLPFDQQRRLMIELDKFSHSIPTGTSTIKRQSIESSVTIPYERTFRNQAARPGDSGSTQAAEFDFCGCGWPHHMLIPKGTAQGYPMVLFCMISNWEEDHVEQDTVGSCNDAASYCGIRDRKYPDRRAMGFPFDRPARAAALADFLRPNMALRECAVHFADVTRQRGQQASYESFPDNGVKPVYTTLASSVNQATITEGSAGPVTQGTITEGSTGPVTQGTTTDGSARPVTQGTITEALAAPTTQGTITDGSTRPVIQGTITESIAKPVNQGTVTEGLAGPATQCPVTECLAGPATQGTMTEGLAGSVTQGPASECTCKEHYTPEEIDAMIRKPYYYIKCNHKQHIF